MQTTIHMFKEINSSHLNEVIQSKPEMKHKLRKSMYLKMNMLCQAILPIYSFVKAKVTVVQRDSQNNVEVMEISFKLVNVETT